MASNWIIPKRYLRLKLFSGRRELKETKLLSDLDINTKVTFEVNATIGGASNSANIVISGLTRDKMSTLATTFTNWQDYQVQGAIVLDVGYENIHGVVFDGGIFAGAPNLDSANYSIRLQCQEAWYETTNSIFQYSFPNGTPVSEIASEIAADGKYVFVNELEDDVLLDNVVLPEDSLFQQIRKLAQISDCSIWIQSGRLYIKNNGISKEEKSNFVIDINNMIGVPEPTTIGCKVRIRLNPSVYIGQRVTLNSIKFPSVNSSDWIIQQISHSGDTKGNKWQTDLLLARSGYGYIAG